MSMAVAPSCSRPSISETDDIGASIRAGLPRSVAEALADPIVQALMAADRVDRRDLMALVCLMAARLSNEERSTGCDLSW